MRGSRLRQGFAGHFSVSRRSFSEDGKPAHDERMAFVTAPALQRTASQKLRAALRPGHEFSD
jgi:hypothetical protein